jgi:single-strand DNA-binding protein
MIIVNGRLQVDEWTDRDGNKRSTVKIVVNNAYFGDSKSSSSDAANESKPNAITPTPTPMGKVTFTAINEDDGDLPF